ncbi:hypothetical protein M3J09_006426 [Ascochyta lentis]
MTRLIERQRPPSGISTKRNVSLYNYLCQTLHFSS